MAIGDLFAPAYVAADPTTFPDVDAWNAAHLKVRPTGDLSGIPSPSGTPGAPGAPGPAGPAGPNNPGGFDAAALAIANAASLRGADPGAAYRAAMPPWAGPVNWNVGYIPQGGGAMGSLFNQPNSYGGTEAPGGAG